MPEHQVDGLDGAAATEATEPPLRAELFSAEQMERHGQTLAHAHCLHTAPGGDQLLQRLQANAVLLQQVCDLLVESVRAGRRITPAAEWLLDNFYLIEEQILTARKHLSKGYSRELPVLASGASAGLARVYDMALEIVAHGDARIDLESLQRFVAAYQSVCQLRLGELWAIPIMLRLALLENLRRIGAHVARGMHERNRASHWADRMLHVAEHDPKSLILVISDMARSGTTLANAFVAELARRLQGHSSALALPLTWMEQSLSEYGQTIEQMVHTETQSQAIHQVCISNSIASLRLLGALDWRSFVEAQSLVEHTLRQDPMGVYARMDFATRDRYRHRVEQTARLTQRPEAEVAALALQLAQQAAQAQDAAQTQTQTPAPGALPGPSPAPPLTTHVGHYLAGDGQARLERALQLRLAPLLALQRRLRAHPLALYLGAVGLLSVAGSIGLLQLAGTPRLPSGAWDWLEPGSHWLASSSRWLLGALALVACSQTGLALVNWLVTVLCPPHVLPRMDYARGLPPEARTLVVVPCLLTGADAVRALVEALEVRYLANQDALLHFGLLSDWADAPSAQQDSDAALLAQAGEGIAALNGKYPGVAQDTFFLFHRPRLWNAQERVWMGYERKRGKLAALNALLRGRDNGCFLQVLGNTAVLAQVRFVITLDTDTQLQRDAARSLAACLAHPLNRAQLDPGGRRVSAGYGLLQPRMAVSLQSSNRSRYARLMGSEAGVDPYTRAVSDVYQDLFYEGSFTGKGIYDVDVFEQVLGQRLPDNRILSHDLLEGCYVRSGLLSDVQLYDDFPARYDADVSRRVRWIRGDWQIASWLLPRVPGPQPGQREVNPLSLVSQWKILDNLRRSLVPPATLALLLLGWALLPQAAAWTLALLALGLLAPLVASAWSLLQRPADLPWRQHLNGVRAALKKQLLQAALALALLPHEAWYSLDAVLRTTLRLLFTQRRLLQWQASEAAACPPVAPGSRADLLRSCARMAMAPVLAVATAALLWRLDAPGPTLWLAAPLVLAWLLAPALVWWLSRPLSAPVPSLAPAQTRFLRLLARRTWCFFERFVTAQDHWLPPDNYQEHPVAVLARRTSPTNMGLALLANATAYDFGYLSADQLLARSADALHSMQGLERYAGHFYNWYDTQTCLPLAPRYISAVDSGNLSGHLLTLRPALLALADQPVLNPRTFEGLADALGNLQEALAAQGSAALQDRLAQLAQQIDSACAAPPDSLEAALQTLERLGALVLQLLQQLQDPTNTPSNATVAPAALPWAQALQAQCAAAQSGLQRLHSAAPAAPAPPSEAAETAGLPSWRALAASGHALARAQLDQMQASGAAGQPPGAGRLRLFVRPHAPSVGGGLQRGRAPPRQRPLRPAGQRGAAVQLCGHCPGRAAAGALVCPGPAPDCGRARAHAAVVERLDVRVPHAQPGAAGVCQHLAGADLPRRRAAPDGLRRSARRALGHFRVGLPHGGCGAQLPVPRLWRAGPGP